MSLIERILIYLRNLKMEVPTRWGWFHILWIVLSLILVAFFIVLKKKNKTLNHNLVFGIYGIGSLILETIKQLMWSVSVVDGVVKWSYPWYCAPYQFCTTPMFVALALLFVKNETIRKHLYCYLGYFTIISSIAVMIIPDTCFVEDILVDIHTMYLHCGGFVISSYVVINRLAKLNISSIKEGLEVFIMFVISALLLNVVVYQSGILKGATFNMFYISPYFVSSLPVFCEIQQSYPYPLFLLMYVLAFAIGSLVVYGIIKIIYPYRSAN